MRPRTEAMIELLEPIPLFAACTAAELEALAAEADERTLPAGATLTRQGERGHEFVVVLEGTAEVTQNGRPINRLGAGDFVGEISLFSGARRTATVTATSEVRILVLPGIAFERLAEATPSFRRRVLAALSERLQADAG
jgi:CRP/FNR family cyclic AMP-dependent transcriptional regulator